MVLLFTKNENLIDSRVNECTTQLAPHIEVKTMNWVIAHLIYSFFLEDVPYLFMARIFIVGLGLMMSKSIFIVHILLSQCGIEVVIGKLTAIIIFIYHFRDVSQTCFDKIQLLGTSSYSIW